MTVVAHDEAQSLKARIFSAAIAVFAEHGLSGARMEQIATEAQTTKRMVVYYFKSKEQLYQEVLQHVYARIRETEQQLGLENVPPVEALVRLVHRGARAAPRRADRPLAQRVVERGHGEAGHLRAGQAFQGLLHGIDLAADARVRRAADGDRKSVV